MLERLRAAYLRDRNATDTLRKLTPMQQHYTKTQKYPLLHCLAFH